MKWNLTQIYTNRDAWAKDLEKLKHLSVQLTKFRGRLNDQSVFSEYLRVDSAFDLIDEKVSMYMFLSADLDTESSELKGLKQQLMQFDMKHREAMSWVANELLAIPLETLIAWCNSAEDLKQHIFGMKELFRAREHILANEMEEVLAAASGCMGNSGTAYDNLVEADLEPMKVTLTSGEELMVRYPEFYEKMSTLKNTADREIVFKAFLGYFHRHRNTIAQLYYGIVARNKFLAKTRKYESSLHRALNGNNVPVDVYHALIAASKAGKETITKYHNWRKAKMELTAYQPWDVYVPVADVPERKFTYPEAVELVKKAMLPLGDEYMEALNHVLESGRVDVLPDRKKSPGAYQTSIQEVSTFILLNFTGTMDCVFTLAHEAGHAVHTYLSDKYQPQSLKGYTIFVAEVASTMCEHMLLDYLLALPGTTEKEKQYLLEQKIDTVLNTFYRQTVFANFEHETHRMIESDEALTADSLFNCYERVNSEVYGELFKGSEYAGSVWSRIPHLFASPFYVYQYATSIAASLYLFDVYKRTGVASGFLDLLKQGGNDHPISQLNRAGVELASPNTVNSVNAILANLVSQITNA